MILDESQLRRIVISSLALNEATYRDSLSLGDVPAWDSVGHLNLVFAIESSLGIQFPMEQIPQLTSLDKIRAAIAERPV